MYVLVRDNIFERKSVQMDFLYFIVVASCQFLASTFDVCEHPFIFKSLNPNSDKGDAEARCSEILKIPL